MKVSSKLNLILRLTGLTQEKLAQRLGVSFVTLNSWINNRSIPHAKKQRNIDEIYVLYTGGQSIPKDVLEAKKQVIFEKAKNYTNVLKTIQENSDIYDQFLLSLTYNTNSIEGSTLTEHETAAVLFQNLSLKNKTLIEQLEVKNHQAAFEYMLGSKEINEDFILMLHTKLMNGIHSDAGIYRSHGVRILGSRVVTANYLKVPELMKNIIEDIHLEKKDVIAHVASIHSQFEKIHPFADGNGRIGRLLMHAMLFQYNIPPALIKNENKALYYAYLSKSQLKEDKTLLEDFFCEAVLESYKMLKR